MRNTGVFLVPTRFMRIFTDINFSKGRGNYLAAQVFASSVLIKMGSRRRDAFKKMPNVPCRKPE
jgi:hypothetical protein